MKDVRSSLQVRMAVIDDRFCDCPDLIKRKAALKGGYEAYFIYFDGLVDSNMVQRDLINPLLLMEVRELAKEKALLGLPIGRLRVCRDSDSLINAILNGEVVFISECLEFGVVADFELTECIDNPRFKWNFLHQSGEFQTLLSTNLALLRRRYRSNRLKFKIREIGVEPKAKIAVAYLEGVAAPSLLNEIDDRIQAVMNEESHDSHLELVMKDFPHSPFPQYQTTKRPDLAVSKLLEGRLAILRDGCPAAILTPTNFFAFFQAPDDLHTHWVLASGMRLFRIIAAMIVVFLPGLYIAVSSFHYQFLNLNLLITLAQSRSNVPFPPIIETILMELFLAVIYELSSRFSTCIGLLMGITGGLFVGGALLATGMISSVLLIVSVFSLMASFLIPINHIETIRLLRSLFIVLAGLLGMLGVAIGASLTFAHLIVLSSLGEPYLQPLIPFHFQKAMNSILKVPLRYLWRKHDGVNPVPDKGARND
ncbi:MAG TPA: spore germination protein [Bacillota bacterium]|nr:spore germination protein [Bacillota bacterium]